MYEGNSSRHRVCSERIADAIELFPALPLDVPFQLNVPVALCPSVATPLGAAFWEIDIKVALSRKVDLVFTKGINVYSLPDEQQ